MDGCELGRMWRTVCGVTIQGSGVFREGTGVGGWIRMGEGRYLNGNGWRRGKGSE